MASLLQQAIAVQRAGDTDLAITLYRQVLDEFPDEVDALTLLGPLLQAIGQKDTALQLLNRATLLAPTHALAWYNLGLAQADNDPAAAQASLLKAVNLAPQQPEFWLALAKHLLRVGNAEAAIPILDNLYQQQPAAELLRLKAEAELALAQQATPEIRTLAAEAVALSHATGDTAVRQRTMVDLNRYDHLLNEPTAQMQAAYMHLSLTVDEALPWVQLARIYLAHSQYRLAIAMLEQALKLDQRSLEIHWLYAFAHALPIYGTQAQIADFLQRYEQALIGLQAHVASCSDDELMGAELLPELLQSLFLGYNGEDICRAQSLAGDIYHTILTRRLGQPSLLNLAEREARRSTNGGNRITLAIVSETFYYHSNMKLRRSWLRRIDRTKFKLCLYHIGDTVDHYTADIRAMADEFHHIPKNFEAMLAKLRADAPDIIQYTNIGLNTITLKLAALRLAPVQATTWGHPITSGMPTIDYFLSSELMEPVEADAHYRETLVRLPGLSIVPEEIFSNSSHFKNLVVFDRAHFGLTDSDTVYLCLQSIQKYLPQHDGIYAEIAAQVPHAKFVFIEHAANAAIMDLFKLRLRGPFLARGLDPDAHLVFLGFQNQQGYSSLHRLADITLDSLEWSGANTTFEALELGGLLLTCPGRFMRGRHTSAILTYIGMSELIANNESDYVQKAIAFGRDPELRQVLRQKLALAKPNLYRDPGLGPALNEFYETAYRRWAAAAA